MHAPMRARYATSRPRVQVHVRRARGPTTHDCSSHLSLATIIPEKGTRVLGVRRGHRARCRIHERVGSASLDVTGRSRSPHGCASGSSATASGRPSPQWGENQRGWGARGHGGHPVHRPSARLPPLSDKVDEVEVTSVDPIPSTRWVHAAGVFGPGRTSDSDLSRRRARRRGARPASVAVPDAPVVIGARSTTTRLWGPRRRAPLRARALGRRDHGPRQGALRRVRAQRLGMISVYVTNAMSVRTWGRRERHYFASTAASALLAREGLERRKSSRPPSGARGIRREG